MQSIELLHVLREPQVITKYLGGSRQSHLSLLMLYANDLPTVDAEKSF